MTADNWYNKPLNLNDKIAGGTLIFFAIIFLSICTITSFVLYRESHVIKSFLYLLSAAINNMFLLINYALLPGILILFKKHVPKYGRRFCQIYFDTMWFSMCYHTLLIAWTRFAAICRPCQFRKQQNSTIYMLCSMCYVIAVVQSTVVYFQPWYVTFYYEASAYGMIPEDIELYLKGGKSQFFTIFHSLIFIATFALYSCALFLLFKYNLQVRRSHVTKITPSAIRPNATRWSLFPTASVGIRTETKLILPCFCNAVVFLIGQVVITIGISENRWTLWLILVLFTFTASVDSLTLLIFSSTIRKGIMIMLRDLFCFRNKKTKVAMIKQMRKSNKLSKTEM